MDLLVLLLVLGAIVAVVTVSKRNAQTRELERKRAEHVNKAPGGGKDGFDEQVLAALRKQAKKFDVDY